jgi:SAM-dependent methyltransferase
LSDIEDKTGAKCFGIDISPIAIKLNKNKKINLKVGDMEKIPFRDKMFDKVFSFGVFEHSPRSFSVFKELNRVMKLGGTAYISVPNKISLFHVIKNIKMMLGIWDLGYEKSFTYDEIKDLLEKTGFELKAFWVEPPTRIGKNPFNLLDKILNKVNNKKFGYFINLVALKTR